ncbi:MAG: DUF5718 family protein [Helicobacteraceae bacterium]|jgi:hypothetical protein|nr:DUF5718 family protein [Helicobacteraceae bacterium]
MALYKDYLGLGIAGNFALHLEQAGELEDFKDVITEDPNGPKGIFPFYVPGFDNQLGVYPLSDDTIILPDGEMNVQAEPELGLVCEITYKDGKVTAVTPKQFGAYNDCSIRKEGAKKISEKKNWGPSSKGLSSTLIDIDKFEEGGMLDHWRICSFVRNSEMLMRYGEDVELSGYSFFYQELLEWISDQINSQVDNGPLEPLLSYIEKAGYPQKAVISIGATRYTPYGEKRFLQEGDEVIVIVYDNVLYCKNPIMMMAQKGELDVPGVSALVQKVKRSI